MMTFLKNKVCFVTFLLAAAVAAGCVCRAYPQKDTPPPPETGKKTVSGIGYVRGIGCVTLKNKYAGFVSKVNFYSQQRVKKGDVILTYDDFEVRKKITDKKNEILVQKETVAEKKLLLQLKELDPLPSNFRNLDYKQNSAQALVSRLKHEEAVYKRLYKSKAISTLSLREKQQSVRSSEADLQQIIEDQKILRQGLSNLYIKLAKQELRNAELHLANLERDLKLLEEEQKYYRIVAPFDGLCITKSDAVHAYNSAGTAAAIVHKDQKKLIYAYFREADVGLIKENVSCVFRSNQYPDDDGIFKIVSYKVEKDRSSYGDNCYYLVKFRVAEEHKPLRIDSTGQVEITVE